MSAHSECFQHRYQAVYNYTPRNEDELELREGDIVDVMEKCDDGWFVGKRTENEELILATSGNKFNNCK